MYEVGWNRLQFGFTLQLADLVHNAAAPASTLRIGLVWWSVAIALAVAYFVHLFRSFAGKVAPAAATTGTDPPRARLGFERRLQYTPRHQRERRRADRIRRR